MKTCPIRIQKIGQKSGGYRVLASWRLPADKTRRSKVNLWIPELAPGFRLLRNYQKNRLSWERFARRYQSQLQIPAAQEYLKPLALLSLRKQMVLLCDCTNGHKCPTRVLERELRACREQGDFILARSIEAGCR